MVRATVQVSVVNERLSLLEQCKLVELLRLMEEKQSRLDLLENCSHTPGQWRAHAKFISGVLGWHGYDQLSQTQCRQDHKDLQMPLKLHTEGAGGKGFEPGLTGGVCDPIGRKKKCWLCNKTGHVAANFTTSKGGRGGGHALVFSSVASRGTLPGTAGGAGRLVTMRRIPNRDIGLRPPVGGGRHAGGAALCMFWLARVGAVGPDSFQAIDYV